MKVILISPTTPAPDRATLTALCADTSRKSLIKHKKKIDDAYIQYHASRGDPWQNTVTVIPRQLRKALRQYYTSEVKGLEHIAKIRGSSPDICTMCGSFKSGTIDHVLPKAQYAEFSFYTANMAPACDCNIKRKKYKGVASGQRVLNPHYDSCLANRVVRATIVTPQTSPVFGLQACCGAIPEADAVLFHIQHVLLRTQILEWFGTYWSKIVRLANDVLPNLPETRPITSAHLSDAIAHRLTAADRFHGTPNNWESMLLAGIQANATAQLALVAVINSPPAATI